MRQRTEKEILAWKIWDAISDKKREAMLNYKKEYEQWENSGTGSRSTKARIKDDAFWYHEGICNIKTIVRRVLDEELGHDW